MRGIKNRVIVKKVDASRWKDEMITPGGLKLFLPTASKVATHDIKYWGEVVVAPEALTGIRANDTEVRLKAGDFVYFNYKTLMRDPLLRLSAKDMEIDRAKATCKHCGKGIEYSSRDSLWVHTRVGVLSGDNGYYCYDDKRPNSPVAKPDDFTPAWECDYSDIFCRVDDKGEIHAIGDWVLVTFRKDSEQLGSGLLINPFEQLVEGQGQVVAISPAANIHTQDGPVVPGDMVYFPHDQGAFENEIEGTPMWCVNASIIFAAEKL